MEILSDTELGVSVIQVKTEFKQFILPLCNILSTLFKRYPGQYPLLVPWLCLCCSFCIWCLCHIFTSVVSNIIFKTHILFCHPPMLLILQKIQCSPNKLNIALFLSQGSYNFVTYGHLFACITIFYLCQPCHPSNF